MAISEQTSLPPPMRSVGKWRPPAQLIVSPMRRRSTRFVATTLVGSFPERSAHAGHAHQTSPQRNCMTRLRYGHRPARLVISHFLLALLTDLAAPGFVPPTTARANARTSSLNAAGCSDAGNARGEVFCERAPAIEMKVIPHPARRSTRYWGQRSLLGLHLGCVRGCLPVPCMMQAMVQRCGLRRNGSMTRTYSPDFSLLGSQRSYRLFCAGPFAIAREIKLTSSICLVVSVLLIKERSWFRAV
jgi:hypothetical protein